MIRHLLSGIIGFAVASFFAVAFFLRPTPETYIMLAALISLAAVARSNPAPLRNFWLRIVARTPDTVPRTT